MQLLLEAALFEKPRALNAWHTYLAQNNLQTIDHASTTLLPLIYRNLREESHPLCKSTYRHTWLSNQIFWAKTLPILQNLLNAGIKKIALLKGMAMILYHYRDFGARVIGDIDILIDRDHLPLAYSLLTSSGWRCELKGLDPENSDQLIRWHAANFTHPSGLNLDLHWSLLLESIPALANDVLETIPPGIQPANPTHLFFQTCIHGYKKSTAPLIRWIPDALTLLKSPIDFPLLFEVAKASHLTLTLSSALAHLSHYVSHPLPTFSPTSNPLEVREFRANLRGNIYLAGYYRARLRNHSLLHYLQHTANLSSPWLVPLYAPYWLFKRIYRFLRFLH